MDHETKAALEKLIDDYDSKLVEAERAAAAKRAADSAFPERFVAIRTKIVRPALQEIADMLNQRGHEAELREQEESSSAAGGVKAASIALRIVPKPFARKATETNPSAIEVAFSANRPDRKITVSSTNSVVGHAGRVGRRGEYEVDEVTGDVVTKQVLETLKDAFRGQR